MRSCATDKLAQTAASQSIILTLLNGILIGSYKTTTMINNFTMIVGIAFAFLGGMYPSMVLRSQLLSGHGFPLALLL